MTGVTVHMQVRSFYIASANYLGKMVGRRPLDELFLYGVDMYRLWFLRCYKLLAPLLELYFNSSNVCMYMLYQSSPNASQAQPDYLNAKLVDLILSVTFMFM